MTAGPSVAECPIENGSLPEFGMALKHIPIEELEQVFAGRVLPEWLRMYLTLAKGLPMGPQAGWFGPAKSRYDWSWLVDYCQGGESRGVSFQDFPGEEAWFHRLDRNADGQITAEDFDWSDGSPWVQYATMIQRLFRRMDHDGDGRLTRDQWLDFFDVASMNGPAATASELRDHWLAGISGGYLAGDAPSREQLLQSFFAGELGSRCEGPRLDEEAPDFVLSTIDGQAQVRLADTCGHQPVVLVFGNLTCGPFRSIYPEVDRIAQRYRGQANFLGIYVREAHPTDGWCMSSNACAGISIPQPRDLGARRAAAQRCRDLLQPTIPWVVDDLQDTAGHAYSALPARLYVIDSRGRVTYKAGRGPFGFKPREMEQSLVMTLLDERRSRRR